jgi:hypothetical protein
MAQTTGAVGIRAAYVGFSSDGAAWTDLGAAARVFDPGERTMMVGSAHTLDGANPILTPGKYEEQEVTVDFLYTETANEAFELLRARHEAGGVVYLRYAPKGNTSGNFMYTSGAGYVRTLSGPGMDAGEAAPLGGSATVVVPSMTKSTIS